MITAPTHNIRPERTLAALALTRGEGTNSTLVEDDPTHSGLGDIEGLPISGPMPPPTKADSAMGAEADTGLTETDDKAKNDDARSDTSTAPMDLAASLNDVDGAAAAIPKAPSRPPPVPPRPKASADQGFKKVEEVARQQDAAEILNNVFDLLSCAFRGNSVLKDGEQGDLIKDLFFSEVTTVRDDNGNRVEKSDLMDNILISTKDRDRTLCAALDAEFGLTDPEDDDVIKYELFKEAAPILEFNVRRLQFENDRARKDESHLALDKILYLDRYLKKTDTLSEEQLQALRDEQWRLQKELRQLEKRRRTLKETDFGSLDLPSVLEETAAYVVKAEEEMPGLVSDSPKTEPDGLAGRLDQRAEELRPNMAEIHSRMGKLEHDIDTVFENCKDHPYRLHAIFIHAGSATGGHYWIYIYDFQNEIWRSYNDETVKEETEETIFQKVDRLHPPTSTGIVYVRADVADKLTQAVCRAPEAKDVEMKDADAEARQMVERDTEFGNLPVLEGVSTE
jgi:ubiquitin carboxyl-terminal hydrolase 25/28